MKTTVNTTAYTTHRPRADSPCSHVPGSRKPTRKPNAAVVAIDQTLVVESARLRPNTSEYRGTGSESCLSANPCTLSPASATAMPPPVNRTIEDTYDGTRKST